MSDVNGRPGGIAAFVVATGILILIAAILFRGSATIVGDSLARLWVMSMDVVLRLVGALVGH